MIDFIDSLFYPLLNWLRTTSQYIADLSVPLSRPINVSQYLGPFALIGPYWIGFITTIGALGFLYVVAYIISINQGILIKFRNMIKWW